MSRKRKAPNFGTAGLMESMRRYERETVTREQRLRQHEHQLLTIAAMQGRMGAPRAVDIQDQYNGADHYNYSIQHQYGFQGFGLWRLDTANQDPIPTNQPMYPTGTALLNSIRGQTAERTEPTVMFQPGQIIRCKREHYGEYSHSRSGWLATVREMNGDRVVLTNGWNLHGEFMELAPDQEAAAQRLATPNPFKKGDRVKCIDPICDDPSSRFYPEGWYGEVLSIGTSVDSKEFIYVAHIARPPDQNNGHPRAHYCFEKVNEALTEGVVEPVFKVGQDVVLDCNYYRERKATVTGVEPSSFEGRLIYTVFLWGSGTGRFYGEHMKVNDNAYKPDKKGHVHDWELKWNGTYRSCVCGLKQWGLACWTQYQWSGKLPDRQKNAHRAIKKELVETPGWTTQPHRTRSYELIADEILDHRINVIGAGAIGSFTVLCLVKMGFRNIHVWDPQKVAIENVGTQLYGEGQVDGYKVGKLKHILDTLGPTNTDAQEHYSLTTHKELFEVVQCDGENPPDNRHLDDNGYYWTGNDRLCGAIIMAVDSMAARKAIWETAKDHTGISWVVDGRMGAENALLYTMDTSDDEDLASYEKTLYTDGDSLREPCTAAGTVYTAMMLAGAICKALKDALMEKKYTRIIHWNIADNAQIVYYKKAALTEMDEDRDEDEEREDDF